MSLYGEAPPTSAIGYTLQGLTTVPIVYALFGFSLRLRRHWHPVSILGVVGCSAWLIAVCELWLLQADVFNCNLAIATLFYIALHLISIMCLFTHMLLKARLLNSVPGSWTIPQILSVILIAELPISRFTSYFFSVDLDIGGTCLIMMPSAVLIIQAVELILNAAMPAITFITGMSRIIRARTDTSTQTQQSRVQSTYGGPTLPNRNALDTLRLLANVVFHPERVRTGAKCGWVGAGTSYTQSSGDSSMAQVPKSGSSGGKDKTNARRSRPELSIDINSARKSTCQPRSAVPITPVTPGCTTTVTPGRPQTSQRLVRLLRRCLISTTLSFFTVILTYAIVILDFTESQDTNFLWNLEVSISWALAVWMLPLPGERKKHENLGPATGEAGKRPFDEWPAPKQSLTQKILVFMGLAYASPKKAHRSDQLSNNATPRTAAFMSPAPVTTSKSQELVTPASSNVLSPPAFTDSKTREDIELGSSSIGRGWGHRVPQYL